MITISRPNDMRKPCVLACPCLPLVQVQVAFFQGPAEGRAISGVEDPAPAGLLPAWRLSATKAQVALCQGLVLACPWCSSKGLPLVLFQGVFFQGMLFRVTRLPAAGENKARKREAAKALDKLPKTRRDPAVRGALCWAAYSLKFLIGLIRVA